MKPIVFFSVLTLSLILVPRAGWSAPLFSRQLDAPLVQVEPQVRQVLDRAGFAIIFTADIGAGLQKVPTRPGSERPEKIHSLIICNPALLRRVARTDLRGLAFCPLRVVLVQQKGRTTILFPLPETAARQDEPLNSVLNEVGRQVTRALEKLP